MSEANWKSFKQFTDNGLISHEDLMTIGNLFAEMHVKGAAAAIQLKQDPTSPELREKAALEHLRSSELCVVLIANMYKNRKLALTDRGYDEVIAHSPRAAKVGRILEYYDDVRDFFEDYGNERQTGIPNPNTVIAEFMRLIDKQPATQKNHSLAELNRFVDATIAEGKPVSFGQLPETLQFAMYDVIKKSEQLASDLRGTSPSASGSLAYNLAIDMVGARLKTGWQACDYGKTSCSTIHPGAAR